MTKDEAIEQLNQGNNITHRYFSMSEYIQLIDGQQYFEDNVKVPKEWWNKDYLSDGWSIYN